MQYVLFFTCFHREQKVIMMFQSKESAQEHFWAFKTG
jgi:hypothetical protein